jgi:hypothetical protein
MKTTLALQARRLAGDALIERTSQLLANERSTTAALLAHLAEIDVRRLYLDEGYSSMFVWCTQVLHLSEHAAYNRIECARASRKFPVILPMLARGDVHLTGIRLLAPHLTRSNYRAVLAEARHLGRAEIAEIVARLNPRPDVPSSVRRVARCGVPARGAGANRRGSCR